MALQRDEILVPGMIYGTAWKEKKTAALTRLALEQGFRAIDTANQRKHYCEAEVGEAVAQAIAEGIVKREELFLQTKFTHLAGQDHRLPYEAHAEPSEQLQQSFASSLEHLQVAYLDAYLLHGPTFRSGWTAEDLEIWRAMEVLEQAGQARSIGVSNVSLEQLVELHGLAKVKPRFVQNRCYASRGWDGEVRRWCGAHGVAYQGFSLLTANSREIELETLQEVARRLSASPQQIVFAFARQIGMLPITGTSDRDHMREDLAANELKLSTRDLQTIENIAVMTA